MNNHGKALRPLMLQRRTALGCFLMALALTAACGGTPDADRSLPPAGELSTVAEEIVVKQHSTFWKVLHPITKGELTQTVDAGDIPVGINMSPIDDGGLTEELNDKMMATQIPIKAGWQGEVKRPVEAGQAYAVYIINETGKPATVKLRTTLRWGPPPP